MGRRKHQPQQPFTMDDINTAVQDNVNQFGMSDKTKKAYGIYTDGGRQFLHSLLDERVKMKVKDSIPNEELAHAFDPIPNRWSSYALLLYIGHKCCGNGTKQCGKSTAEGIYSAWAKLWTKAGYGDEYRLNASTGEVAGCPAKAYEVKELIKSIKARAAKKGGAANRHCAEAITIEDMRSIMEWSEARIRNEWLEGRPLPPGVTVLNTNNHGLFRAFASTAFTLFTRNFETCAMQYGDLDLDRTGPLPNNRPFIAVEISERKGWQREAANDGVTEQVFEVFKQADHPEIDMYSHLKRWLAYMTIRLGRPLEPDDYLFPHIAPNGAIHSKSPISYDGVMALLREFSEGAGIKRVFTTHCFRRGGAQYRFMYAPPKERWSLNAIQWWGGWVVGPESVDVVVKYLVNSLSMLENDYRHLLDPDRGRLIDRREYLGSNSLADPVSQEDFLDLKACFTNSMDKLTKITSQLAEHAHEIPLHTGYYNQPQFYSAPPTSRPAQPTATTPSLAFPSAPPTARPTTYCHSSNASSPALSPHPLPIPTIPSSHPYALTPAQGRHRHSSKKKTTPPVPIPGVYIPNLSRGPLAWREAVRQWEEGDGKGLRPLRDWPREWYTGDMRTVFGAKYSQRKVIAKEFNRLKRDEALFIETYPESKGIRVLLDAIYARAPIETTGGRRRSKNGSPLERDSRKASESESESENSDTD